MKWKFEQEFRTDKPETIGESDSHFDLDNYKDWLEEQLTEARSKLHLDAVSSQRELLLDFAEYSENDEKSEHLDELVDNYLDSIKQ